MSADSPFDTERSKLRSSFSDLLSNDQKEGKIMAGQILVSLSSHARIEGIISQIEQMAKPGTKVTFLTRYPVDSWAWLRDHWINSESPKDAMLAGRRVLETYSYAAQRQLAEQMVLSARNTLSKMGVEIAVDVYTGPIRTVVETYTRKGDVQLVTQAKRGIPMIRLMHRAIAFKRTSSPSVLHPGY
jgi:hypothetical protein